MAARAKGFRETAEEEAEASNTNSGFGTVARGESKRDNFKPRKKSNLVKVMKCSWKKAVTSRT